MSQAAKVTDDAFTAQIWRQEELGNVQAAETMRQQWKHARTSGGYQDNVGALTSHEIDSFSAKYLISTGADDARAFARAVERAALIKAITLLPELRIKAPERKASSHAFRSGMDYGFAIYCGAVTALAFGRSADGAGLAVQVKPRKHGEISKIEDAVNVDAGRPKFEAWAGSRQFDLRRQNGAYTNTVTAYTWMGWLAAGLQRCPSEGAEHGKS